MPASFCSHILSTRTMCFSRPPSPDYSASAETRKPIYRIRRCCNATSEYSPIHSIGLTLFNTIPSFHHSIMPSPVHIHLPPSFYNIRPDHYYVFILQFINQQTDSPIKTIRLRSILNFHCNTLTFHLAGPFWQILQLQPRLLKDNLQACPTLEQFYRDKH